MLELENGNGARIREQRKRKKISGPQGDPEKLKVNCLVVTIKIMFRPKWYKLY